jgi:oligo-1,6-glucosidase
MLTLNSKLKDIYNNPVGHDVIKKILLQMNQKENTITNPLVANLKLKTVKSLTKKKLGEEFFTALLTLLNSEQDVPTAYRKNITEAWWKEAVFYQIYPRSFMDGNDDGIGDLQGIRSKLDYLKNLGVNVLWLSPIYDSPNDDNGYDIRDYFKIMKEFGTMADFDALLAEVHKRDMRLIMDLVVNHTSDEHVWFQEAIKNPDSKYKNFYHFKKSKDEKEPNNWTSFFSGPAWNYYKELDQWALHLFSKKQMDLNWDCEELRQEIITMIQWWLKKGVDGFRLDVINYISKEAGLTDGDNTIGNMMGYYGIEHYFYGPNLHKYLREINEKAFAPFKAFSVGEMPGIGMEMGKLLTGDNRKELDMFFSFDHLEMPGKVRFDDYKYDLNYLKKYLIDWTENYGNHCWMSLFYNNHDNPRFISKVNGESKYREVLAKLLAVIQFTLQGTPFVFQGDEIGAVNKKFNAIEDLKDIESINLYSELQKEKSSQDAFHRVLAGSRDHARTPMQWSESLHGGFTKGTPWIVNDSDYITCNVKQQLEDEKSVLNFYKDLIALHKTEKTFIYGDVTFIKKYARDYFLYCRTLENKEYYIECNLSDQYKKRIQSAEQYTLIMSNYNKTELKLKPYEANIYIKNS